MSISEVLSHQGNKEDKSSGQQETSMQIRSILQSERAPLINVFLQTKRVRNSSRHCLVLSGVKIRALVCCFLWYGYLEEREAGNVSEFRALWMALGLGGEKLV